MHHNPRIVPILVLVAVLYGCSSSVMVHEISQPLPAGRQEVAGIPFRLAEGYTLRVYQRTSAGEYVEVHSQRERLPDPDRLLAVELDAGRLADNELDLQLREDGTLSVVDLSESQKLDEAIQTLGGKALDVAEQAITFEDQVRAKELERLTQATELEAAQASLETVRRERDEAPGADREAALEAALEALTAAELAAETLAALPDEATEAERAAAKGALRLARLKANHAFRRAGLTEPFPGVFP